MRVVKLRIVRVGEYVAFTGETKNTYKILVGKIKG
jgi:hypothetical protein